MKYAIKKIITMLFTLLLISFLVFLAFNVIPGDPATAKLGTQATPEKVEALRHQMGLDRPFFVRYFEWLGGAVTFQFGTSYSYNMSVIQLIGSKLPVTLMLAFLSFIMMTVIAIPVGIYAAKHEGSKIDRFITVVNQGIMAIPPFFAGILITLLFGLILRFFKPGGYVGFDKSFWGCLYYLLFPAFAIALPKAAMTIKLLRSSLLSEAKKDYVRTAYSRGNSTTAVLYNHVLKNSMISVTTFLAMTLTDMIAGSVIMEQVFSVPGIGRILITSISGRDYPVVMAIILLLAFLVILVNLISDIVCHILDPRIRQEV